ncbi:hypothetical protein BDQ17DRAFT_1434130 [Cyathus striatus]|nr:hypothetical protein BDQ17DRAFT_1434130 [Cyathus striatus]
MCIEVPTATLAITHHNDWKVLTEEEDNSLPDPDELTQRLELYFDIEQDSELKVMFLRLNDRIP